MFTNELQQKQSIVETNKGIWVSREILQMDLTPSEKLVYALLCQLSQMDKQAAYITNKQVSQITGIAETTVKNKIKPELRKLGLLKTVGIYNDVKHLKGDTKGMHLKGDTKGMHLKGDTKGTPQDTHLKGDTKGMHLKGDGDMHLKGDRGCTQKVTQNNKEILKENIKVNYLISDSLYNDTLSKQDVNIVKRDCHQSDIKTDNNPLGGFEIVPDVPEWMFEVQATEPFEQYTDDIQGEPMQKTNNNTSKTDERKNEQTMKQQTTTYSKTKSWKSEIDKGYDDREQVPHEHRAEARKWYWSKWNAFISTLNERTIEDNHEWFKWFKTRLCIVTAEKYYREQRDSIGNQYKIAFNKRWWNEWNALIDGITENPQTYLSNTRKYADKAEHLQNLLKQMLKGDELNKHRLAAELKYRNATQPLLQTIKYEDPDTIGKDNSGFDAELGISVETYNPIEYDAATGAYYYTGE